MSWLSWANQTLRPHTPSLLSSIGRYRIVCISLPEEVILPTCSLCLAAFSASFNATWLTLREPHQPRPRAQGIIRTSPHLFLLSTVSEEYFRQLVFSSSHPFHNIGNYFNALTTTKLFFGSISSFDLVLHISDSSAHTEYLGTTQAGIGIKYSPIIFRPDYSVQYQSTHIPRLPNISIVCEGLTTTTPPKQSKAKPDSEQSRRS